MNDLTNGERLALLEQSDKDMREDLKQIKSDLSVLKEIASLGKGAIWAFMKVGAFFILLAGVGEFIFAYLSFHKIH